MKRLYLISTLFILPLFAKSPQVNEDLNSAMTAIDAAHVYQLCKTMTCDDFAGRYTGHDGYSQASHWAAGLFKKWGLKPINDAHGFLQPYSSPYTLVDDATLIFQIPDSTGKLHPEPLKAQDDFLPILFTDSGHQKTGIVFAGWGISAPELNYDDYAGVDVQGKFVLCFRGVPNRQDDRFTQYDAHRTRMKTARQKGALGLIYIYNEPLAMPNGEWQADFMPIILSARAADKVLAPHNLTSESLKGTLTSTQKPASFLLQSHIDYSVSARHFPDATGYNIAGYVEGGDPKLKDDFIIVGGHFDHCGCHMGLCFMGAQDNASGSSVVMETAKTFAALKQRPKRSVMFVLFGGEEMGLMGSNHFAAHLPSVIQKVDAMFNFDMCGTGDGTGCGYTSANLLSVIQKADAQVNTLKRSWEIKKVGVRSSDYAPFFHLGAPCASFYSNGPHLFYHQTGDRIYRINPDMLTDMTRLAFLSAFKWANR